MEASTGVSELLRLKKIKLNLERQEEALNKMLEVIDNQLLHLEVEDLQLASNIRERENMKDENSGDDESAGNESEHENLEEDDNLVENLNKTELDLDSRLDEMLSGQFYVEEDEEDEVGDADMFLR